MAWIKRNLLFLIGSLVALALMAGGGYFLYQQISIEAAVSAKIAEQYTELQRLYKQNPHPGVPPIDNIQAARDEEKTLRDYVKKIHPLFERIPPIPDSGGNKVSAAEFATQLRNTVAQLHHTAEQQSVILSTNYYFTFEAEKNLVVFDSPALNSMASHLGEIKAICDILFDAKVNTLDSIRREKISELNDNYPSDYLGTQKTITNTLAELTPYEVTFKSFSAELALVLGSLAGSPNGFIVKSINVEPVMSAGGEDMSGSQPIYTQPPQNNQGGFNSQGIRRGGYVPPNPAPTMAPTGNRPQEFLKEKVFKVTLSIIVVKLKPAK